MTARQVWQAVLSLPQLLILALIRVYQLTLSPLLGPRCKYYPSCSHYGLEAVRVHGAIVGPVLAAWRVLRCNPWSHGGIDDVPAKGAPLFSRAPQTSSETAVSMPTS